ncbi:heme ABC exporter ATP-binding protein CcmA [Sphingomonas sp.]|jgi:heme exporter protein A|uniref:heme ABC exporter ATP-binding protein CcmA n=1 Tax=Sphingomonas sp. TaxID=28214 RepID=UPI002E33F9C0|nr:heme ABC exporter ATP-binding protein CcmA [Sphingomonas sp.]HEX4694235.1 heme ABC exporter ATP-binding protein CcmA [Sphingomonas sp.]
MLSFTSVTCVRGGRALFADLSFALAAGGAVLVSGPNGAGKSSLIRVAAGLLRVAAGEVACAMPRALLTEQAALDPELPLAKALAFWARLDCAGAQAVPDALAALRLDPLSGVPVRLLSTGQRRRAAIARVVASGAPIWLLDEPANGLDSAAVERLEAVIAGHRAGGGAVLVASHTPVALPDALLIHLRLPAESPGPVASGAMLDPGLRRGGV